MKTIQPVFLSVLFHAAKYSSEIRNTYFALNPTGLIYFLYFNQSRSSFKFVKCRGRDSNSAGKNERND
jgi:hypothetical protein